MLYQIKAYFHFLIQTIIWQKEKPAFVFELTKYLFRSKIEHSKYLILNKYRESLYSNNSTLQITDFGAGSRVFKSNTRKISSIAKNAGITKKRAQLLCKLTSYYNFQDILELGTSLGLATSAFSLGNPKASITTIEGCPETAKIAQQQFNTFQLNTINLKINAFENELAQLKQQKFDCIYVDGNHKKDATLSYFNILLNNVHENSILIFDDIHWSKDMTKAWNEIKQHPRVTLSIDSFFWGFIFFKKEIKRKQHLYLLF